MKKMMLASSLLIATSFAHAEVAREQQISSFTVVELPLTAADKALGPGTTTGGSSGGVIELPLPTPPASRPGPTPNSSPTFEEGVDKVGKVISTARDIVALGESIYTLVQKGKPSNTTEYAPISVVPKDPMTKEALDPFELEYCSMPVTKKFRASVTNGVGSEVVRFEYMVIYTIGCQYNGAGKYIMSAMVQPVSVKTSFGWDFTATMKLNGIMNHGSKADPIAGALLTMKYQMNSWSTSFERNDTIHITGKGDLKTY